MLKKYHIKIDRKSNKKIWGKAIYFIPLLLGFLGLIVFYKLVPVLCNNKNLNVIFFADSKKSVSKLYNFNNILNGEYNMLIIRTIYYIWLSLFIISLFYLGKKLHRKPLPNKNNIGITKTTLCLLIQDIISDLKQIKNICKDNEINYLIYKLKCLAEKMSIESDFGNGSLSVLECEDEIAHQLKLLSEYVKKFDFENCFEYNKKLNEIVLKINTALYKRSELKRCK